jgi:hypothetical protein
MRQRLADPWLRPTLLGAAFDAGDIEKAGQLAKEVSREGPVAWQLQSTLNDLKVSTQYVKDDAMRARFAALLGKLELLLA